MRDSLTIPGYDKSIGELAVDVFRNLAPSRAAEFMKAAQRDLLQQEVRKDACDKRAEAALCKQLALHAEEMSKLFTQYAKLPTLPHK